MNNLIIRKSVLATAKITATPAAGQRFTFDNIPDISYDNIRLYGIELFTETELLKDDKGNTLVSATGIKGITVTLVTQSNQEVISQMPAFNLVRSSNGGFITLLNGLQISLTSCYIELFDSTGISANEVVALNLYYEKIR